MKVAKREIQRRIAYEAARILTDSRIDDHDYAIHKAASRLGINNKRLMPKREEIYQALREQQRLFRGDEQLLAVEKMRYAAHSAMQALQQFKPLLVGPVFEGTADLNSRIRLHLFASTPEEVALCLMGLHIPWHEKDCSIKFAAGGRKNMPSFRFTADGNLFKLIVFPEIVHNNPPVEPDNNHPIRGITLQKLGELINQR